MTLSDDVVDALYRALLGRPPDAPGARAWARADTVEDVIAGFATTDEFARRVEQLGEIATARSGGGSRWASALALGGGVTSLDGHASWAGTGWLLTLPWEELRRGDAPASARVLGPYARELASEATRRGLVASCQIGLDHPQLDRQARQDVLVLSEYAYLQAILTCRVDLVTATRGRLLCPTPAMPRAGPDRAAAIMGARRRLHAAGFLEVAVLTRRRHGGGTVVHDVSHSTPDPQVPLLVASSARLRGASSSAWLVADRVPRRER